LYLIRERGLEKLLAPAGLYGPLDVVDESRDVEPVAVRRRNAGDLLGAGVDF
jgi:hypothetical protein